MELLPTILNNYERFFERIIADYKNVWLILIAIIFITSVIIFTIESRQNKIISAAVGLIALIGMTLVMFGVFPLLSSVIIEPRLMYGFGVLHTILSIYIVSRREMYAAKIAPIVLCWFLVVFGFTYGNMLNNQAEYENFRRYAVLCDLNQTELLKNGKLKKFAVKGTVGYAKSVQNAMGAFPALRHLIRVMMADSAWYWASYKLSFYYGLENIQYVSPSQISKELPLIKDTPYHAIYGDEENILIELK